MNVKLRAVVHLKVKSILVIKFLIRFSAITSHPHMLKTNYLILYIDFALQSRLYLQRPVHNKLWNEAVNISTMKIIPGTRL